MKRILSLVLGAMLVAGMSISVAAESALPSQQTNEVSIVSVMPRKSYEYSLRTIRSGSSWTSKSYYCSSGTTFGGGLEDPVSLTGKIQYSSSSSGPWTTLSTKSLKGSGMTIDVEDSGYYRFVLTNGGSSSVSVECCVIIN